MRNKLLLFGLLAFGLTLNAQTSKEELDKTITKGLEYSNQKIDKVANTTTSGIKEVYSDSKDAISVVYSDVKSLGPKVEGAIKELAKGLKVGAESVWHILVKQQRVLSWCYLIGFIFSIASWIHFYYRFSAYSKKFESEDTNWNISCSLITVLSLVLSIGLSVMSITHLEPMMTGFINPEFGAMRNIVEVARNLK